MTQITVATFNVENLFTRFKFRKPANAIGPETSPTGVIANTGPSMESDTTNLALLEQLTKNGVTLETKNFERLLPAQREITAAALKAVKADFVGLQEVENLDTLRLFNTHHLRTGKFNYQLLIDGNDPRFIDIGVLTQLEIETLRTHQFRRKSNRKVFSRDCLEVEVKVGSKTLPIFINHFKSMLGGRLETKAKREQQCREVMEILTERFGTNYGSKDFIVIGDMNDYMEAGKESESGLRPLLESGQMENVINRIPDANERWTHFYNGDKTFHQLDYILLSNSLATKNAGAIPVIERRGQSVRVNIKNMPVRVPKFFPGVGRDDKGNDIKASDHCPMAITLNV